MPDSSSASSSQDNLDLYSFNPSKIPAYAAALVFLLTTVFHLFQVIRHRSWYLIPLLIGGIFEILGYLARVASISSPTKIGPYAISVLLILVAPTLFAASVYMVLGRLIITLRAEKLSPVRPSWMTKVFVAGDIVAFLAQAGGAAILAKQTQAALNLGQKIIVIGLFLQLAFFGFFCFIIILFHSRVSRYPPSAPSGIYSSAIPQSRNPTRLFPAIYVASGLILIRSIFRVVEYLWRSGPWKHTDVYMYVLDALPMAAMLIFWNIFPPGKFVAKKVKGKRIGEEGEELVSSSNAASTSQLWTPPQR